MWKRLGCKFSELALKVGRNVGYGYVWRAPRCGRANTGGLLIAMSYSLTFMVGSEMA